MPLDVVKLSEAELAHRLASIAFTYPRHGERVCFSEEGVSMAFRHGESPLKTTAPGRAFLIHGRHADLTRSPLPIVHGDSTSISIVPNLIHVAAPAEKAHVSREVESTVREGRKQVNAC